MTLPLTVDEAGPELTRAYLDEHDEAPASGIVTEAVQHLATLARFRGEQHEVQVRVAQQGSAHYLDLGSDDGRCIEITTEGWRVIDEPPVKFLRPAGMLALPEPQHGGDLEELAMVLNIQSEDWVLLAAMLVAMVLGISPFPILILLGEQGSAKSTATRLLHTLIDPHQLPLRTLPRNEQDLAIAAAGSYLLCFDNVSILSDAMSDALARLVTGIGFATRQLYTDRREVQIPVRRPILMNGIDEFAGRPDLLDRALVLELSPIPPDRRRTEAEVIEQFNRSHGRILGAILDLAARAVGIMPSLHLETLPRMADFARLGEAVAIAREFPEGAFREALEANRDRGDQATIERSAIFEPLMAFADRTREFRGTARELLSELRELAVASGLRLAANFPQTPNRLSQQLRRLLPLLRTRGIEIRMDFRTPDRARQRLIEIRVPVLRERGRRTAVAPTLPAPPPADDADDADDELRFVPDGEPLNPDAEPSGEEFFGDIEFDVDALDETSPS
ncbi:MAG: hypothetical protein K1X74_04195 [Pirellulales bacterium]|nr:hypothetical protein [Pirellulales bacterium]